jgi:hypothetical protein
VREGGEGCRWRSRVVGEGPLLCLCWFEKSGEGDRCGIDVLIGFDDGSHSALLDGLQSLQNHEGEHGLKESLVLPLLLLLILRGHGPPLYRHYLCHHWATQDSEQTSWHRVAQPLRSPPCSSRQSIICRALPCPALDTTCEMQS